MQGFASLFGHKMSVFCNCYKVWKDPCSVRQLLSQHDAKPFIFLKQKKKESRKVAQYNDMLETDGLRAG